MSKKDAEILTSHTYSRVANQATQAGSRTFAGEERHRKGLGLDPLVDPSKHGLIRRSLNRMEQLPNNLWKMMVGVAMLIEDRLDTTGSMGNNVQVAFDAMPRMYELLQKVLGRYDLQILTSIFGDYLDDYILCRSQAEMGAKIVEQMTLMIPEHGGYGNHGEDPQYGLFAGAYLTSADINRYDLKYYDFTVTDEPSHDTILMEFLERVFGKTVLEKVAENGHKGITVDNLPSVKKVVSDLLKNAHAFVFIIGDSDETLDYWPKVFPKERIIRLRDTSLLPEVKAAIIGLTEGVLSLNGLEDFLVKEAKISNEDAKMIKRAVAGIPIGAQAKLPNFNKLPKAGDIFKEKRNLYPMSEAELEIVGQTTVVGPVKSKGKKKKGPWL